MKNEAKATRQGKQAGLAAPKPKTPRLEAPPSKEFSLICHDMYKRFGAAYATLRALCRDDTDKYLLSDTLHELRTSVRNLLQEAKDAQ